ncbi:MAG: hypothetical protein ACPGSL_04235, partial [Vicingaceae bacterium]
MKKLIVLFSLIITNIMMQGQVQTLNDIRAISPNMHLVPSPNIGNTNVVVQKNISSYQNQNKTANCVDTIYYPHSKMTSLDGLAILDAASGTSGISQTFEANAGTIHGIRAFVVPDDNGIAGDGPNVDVQISVVNVNAQNVPTTVIASEVVNIADMGDVHQDLMFSVPVPVTDRYAVTIELNPITAADDTLWYMKNNQTVGDGGGQGLMAFNFLGTWRNFFIEFGVVDADALFAPIFEKTINSDYVSNIDSICIGGSVVFTNNSDIDTSYMYNLHNVFNADMYTWNYDDGTGTYAHEDTTYTFNVAGELNTQLLITSYGYTSNCVDSSQLAIGVVDLPNVATSNDTSICIGGTADISVTGALSYTWDNGLGAGTNHSVSPITDTMYVVTGLGFFGCLNTDTVDVTVVELPSVTTNLDTIFCGAGQSYTVAATGADTYFWDNGLGTGQSHTVSPLSSTTYTVTGTDALGCQANDAVTVSIVNCSCLDTIYYPRSKMTSFDGLAILDVSSGTTGAAQTFESNTGFIHGIRAFVVPDNNGIPGDGTPVDLQISVVNVDAQNIPTTVISSEIVSITDLGNVRQNLMFSSPVAVSDRYAVAVELNPLTAAEDTVYYMKNNQTANDGAGQGLLALNFLGTWRNFFIEFGVVNADALFAPIFDKTITSDFTVDTDSVCLGSSIVFTNNSSLDTNYMYNRYDSLGLSPYEWNYQDGMGAFNHSDTTYTFASAGSFNTQLLAINHGYTTTCYDTAFQEVHILEQVVVASVDTGICIGGTANLSATGATNYLWDNGLGAGQSHAVSPIVDTDYIVNSSNAFGCVGSDTVSVSINALPTITASNDTTICEGGTANLSAIGGVTYLWDNGLGAGQNQPANPTVDTTYRVTGTDANGCVGIDSVMVTINAAPIVTASIDTTVCIGDNANISATSTIGTFTWDNGLGNGQSHSVSPTALTTYIVSVVDGIGCDGYDTVHVSVNQLPVLTTNLDTSVCAGDSITLFATGASTYLWDNGLGAGQNHTT